MTQSPNVETVYLGKNINSIGNNPFNNCVKLTNLVLHEDNKHFRVVDGVLMTYESTEIISYLSTNPNATYSIPDGVRTIKSFAFSHNSHITEITIPSSVSFIHSRAFYMLSNLQTIRFEGTTPPECSNGSFENTSPTTIIVPTDYPDGKLFCSFQVTKTQSN